MSNNMRWRYGETNPVMMTVQSGTVIEIGDLLYLDGGSVKPASSQADQGDLSVNQELFHDNFIGVAMQGTLGETTETIRVATSGVFEFACLSAAFSVGDLIGCTEKSSGVELESQVVIGVGAENLALGRCVKQAASGSVKVLVDIVSTALRGGPQSAV